MNFKFTKKKFVWGMVISVLGDILALYILLPNMRQVEISASEGVLSSLSPLGQGMLYLFIFFIGTLILLFVAIYVLWSFFEGNV